MAELKDKELNEVAGGFIDSDDYTHEKTYDTSANSQTVNKWKTHNGVDIEAQKIVEKRTQVVPRCVCLSVFILGILVQQAS